MESKNFEKMVNQTFNFNLAVDKESNQIKKPKPASTKDMLDVAKNMTTFFPLCIYFSIMCYNNFHGGFNLIVFAPSLILAGIFILLSSFCFIYMLAVFFDTHNSESEWVKNMDSVGKPTSVVAVIFCVLSLIALGCIFFNDPNEFLKVFTKLDPNHG